MIRAARAKSRMEAAALRREYRAHKQQINRNLKAFRAFAKSSERDIFAELCFCILTPQSNALRCDEAIRKLRRDGYLLKGSAAQVKTHLKGVRFHNKKALFLIAARRRFMRHGHIAIKQRLYEADTFRVRDWLVGTLKGIGYKEASHFLRNIGLGENIAILDRHILRNLKQYGVINAVPACLTRAWYLAMEEKMRDFAKRLKIPLEALDLVLWAKETGFVFK